MEKQTENYLTPTNPKTEKSVLTETLTGHPTIIYSTVRDGEIEQQETDRAIELTPTSNTSKESKE